MFWKDKPMTVETIQAEIIPPKYKISLTEDEVKEIIRSHFIDKGLIPSGSQWDKWYVFNNIYYTGDNKLWATAIFY